MALAKISSLSLLALLVVHANGHMQMIEPLPIRSPNDPEANNPDYDYVSPLSVDGSDYPCKGYHTDPFRATAEYQAGQEYRMGIEGGASHGGGSCQLSLSYDNGETFSVIKSLIGGCPLTTSYDFTIPADAPSGAALFAWSWFNMIGNREMYMNCAQVKINGQSSRSRSLHSHSRHSRNGVMLDRKTSRRQATSAFEDTPKIFVANVNGPGHCKTIEGENVQFPNPGEFVEFGQPVTAGDGFTCSGSIAGPLALEPPASGPTPDGTPVLSGPTLTQLSSSCALGETFCNSATSFSICTGPGTGEGGYTFMGSVASGMKCVNGEISRA